MLRGAIVAKQFGLTEKSSLWRSLSANINYPISPGILNILREFNDRNIIGKSPRVPPEMLEKEALEIYSKRPIDRPVALTHYCFATPVACSTSADINIDAIVFVSSNKLFGVRN